MIILSPFYQQIEPHPLSGQVSGPQRALFHLQQHYSLVGAIILVCSQSVHAVQAKGGNS